MNAKHLYKKWEFLFSVMELRLSHEQVGVTLSKSATTQFHSALRLGDSHSHRSGTELSGVEPRQHYSQLGFPAIFELFFVMFFLAFLNRQILEKQFSQKQASMQKQLPPCFCTGFCVAFESAFCLIL